MAAIIAPATVRVSIRGTVSQQPWAVVLDVGSDAGGGPPPAADAATRVVTYFQQDFLPALTNNVAVTGAHYADLSSLDGATGDIGYEPSVDHVGGRPAEAAPPNVAYLMRKLGPHSRAQRSGRIYLPGVDEGEVDSRGALSTPMRTLLNNKGAAFLDHLTGDGVALVVLHTGGTTSIVEQLTAESLVATQRRRLRRTSA